MLAPCAVDVLTPTANDQQADILARCGARDIVHRNGVVASLSLTGRSFITFGTELLAQHQLEEVRLIACAFLVNELALCQHWRLIRRVNLRGNQLGFAQIRRLIESGLLTHVEAVDLTDNGLSVSDAAELHAAFPLASSANSILL